jgi:cardiolipin synthase A/B
MPAQRALLAGAALSVLVLCSCAAVPTIPEPHTVQTSGEIQPIHVRSAHGPLSQREANSLLRRVADSAPDADALARHLAVEQALAGTPLYSGNKVTVLRDGQQTFGAIFNAIHQAQHYLYLEYFIFQDVTFNGEHLSDLLIERHQHGVQINIVYDAIGSFQTPGSFFDRLQQTGIRIQRYAPISPFSRHFAVNKRDHRKILMADGQLGIIGGVNLSTDYEHTPSGGGGGSSGSSGSSGAREHKTASLVPGADEAPPPNPPKPNDKATVVWHDTDIEIEGPAVVELKELFEQHWHEQGGKSDDLVHDDDPPGPQGEQVMRVIGSRGGQVFPRYYATMLSAIRTATTRIWIEAAYFVPTHQERQALARAARRGVDVRLLLPSKTDSKAALAVQHANYGAMLHAGVKIYERDDGILHSKTAVMDSVWSVIGSSNFDHRSVLFNDEVDAVVLSAATGATLEQDFLQDLQHAHLVDYATWRKRPEGEKFREEFWQLWQQML